MATTEEAWEFQERLAYAGLKDGLCFLDLRRRVEALEGRAAAPAPKPAPAADRPLWEVMRDAFTFSDAISMKWSAGYSTQVCYAAEIDAVAEWLAAGHPTFAAAANALRAEARCTREGRRG